MLLLIDNYIINTIGSVDDLIEKYQEITQILEKILVLKYRRNESKNEVIKLQEVLKCTNGGTFKTKDYVSYSPYKLITIKNITDNGFDPHPYTYFNLHDVYKKYELNIGDIVMTMTGYIGRAGIVDEKNCFQNQRTLKISCVSKSFVYATIKANEKAINDLGSGSAQANLSLIDFLNIDIPYSLEEIKKFKDNDCLFDSILIYKMKIKQLINIKDKLLQKYF